MKLIDADEFVKTLDRTSADVCADFGDGFAEFGYSKPLIRLLLQEAPTINAVSVVRCKKCVLHGNCITEDRFSFAEIENPFCCAGKQKEGAD